MSNRVPILAAAIAANVAATPALAYELATHARLTHRGYVQSNLNLNHPTRGALALPKGSFTMLGEYYCVFDSTGQCRTRKVAEFDWNRDKFPEFTDVKKEIVWQLPLGWMMRGAVREDDGGRIAGFVSNHPANPQDDPDGGLSALNRFCNHFLEPILNRPLMGDLSTVLCLGDNLASAPVWALGKSGPFATPLTSGEDGRRRNHFTVYDAREAMWRALTLTELRLGNPVPIDGDQNAQKREDTRKFFWATAFRALGDVLHLAQDMAQPQHTRNEKHFAAPFSLYEEYVDARAVQKVSTEIKIDNEIVAEGTRLPPLPYDGYPTPHFVYLSDYWSTGSGVNNDKGKGLANYSNRGFFTHGAAINNSFYSSPSPYPGVYATSFDRTPAGASREYLDGKVPDTLLDQTDTIHMARKNLLHESFLAQFGSATPDGTAVYSLDRTVFDDQAKLLIPRAVAYSAGVMDHFFRGAMEISMSDLNAYAIADHGNFAPGEIFGGFDRENSLLGFDKIRLKLKNTTPDIQTAGGFSVPQPMSNGRVVAVAKFHRNLCYTPDLRGELVAAADLARCRSPVEEVVTSEFGTSELGALVQEVPFGSLGNLDGTEMIFRFPAGRQIPINAWDVILQVVFRGQLGSEDDVVVVASKDISEPTFIQFQDVSDCGQYDPPGAPCTAFGVPGVRYRADLFLQPRFAMRPNRYGVILSLGYPSAPQRAEQNFPGRITRIAGLFDLDQAVEMRRFVLKEYYDPFEDPTSHAVTIAPNRTQLPYDALAAEWLTWFEAKFREVPVGAIERVMWWAPGPESLSGPEFTESNSPSTMSEYFAGRPARIPYPTPVAILNW